MSLPTIIRAVAIGLMIGSSYPVYAGVTEENPGEYAAMETGTALVNGYVSSQTKEMGETAALQGAIAGEYTVMKSWEGKYNSYLKTAQGYAEQIKSCIGLYAEGVKALRNIYNLQRAITHNPQGIITSACLTDIYLETAITAIKTYHTLKQVVAKGGAENMLNGAERTLMLSQLNEDMEELNDKIRKLTLAVAFYTVSDLWNYWTAGMFDRDEGQVAREAMKRWKRAYQVGYEYGS